MNCVDNCQRLAPIVFLMPTSFARSADLAVDKFIKLIQAISNIIIPIAKNILVYFLSNFW